MRRGAEASRPAVPSWALAGVEQRAPVEHAGQRIVGGEELELRVHAVGGHQDGADRQQQHGEGIHRDVDRLQQGRVHQAHAGHAQQRRHQARQGHQRLQQQQHDHQPHAEHAAAVADVEQRVVEEQGGDQRRDDHQPDLVVGLELAEPEQRAGHHHGQAVPAGGVAAAVQEALAAGVVEEAGLEQHHVRDHDGDEVRQHVAAGEQQGADEGHQRRPGPLAQALGGGRVAAAHEEHDHRHHDAHQARQHDDGTGIENGGQCSHGTGFCIAPHGPCRRGAAGEPWARPDLQERALRASRNRPRRPASGR
jgi:hypothetical protein